jgi:E3 ubiquitin-protein ligase BIG BROTHER-like protein
MYQEWLPRMNIDELYENWVTDIVNLPLTSRSEMLMTNSNSRRTRQMDAELNNALRINQQLVSNLYNLRRYLEMEDNVNDNPWDNAVMPVHSSYPPHAETLMHSSYPPATTTNRSTSNRIPQSSNANHSNSYTRVRTSRSLSSSVTFEHLTNANGVIDLLHTFLDFVGEPNSNVEMEDVKVTLRLEEFEKFNQKDICEENLKDFDNQACNVCIENYQLGDTVVTLPCVHVFHQNCIKHWLCNEKVTCPVCRHDTRLTK